MAPLATRLALLALAGALIAAALVVTRPPEQPSDDTISSQSEPRVRAGADLLNDRAAPVAAAPLAAERARPARAGLRAAPDLAASAAPRASAWLLLLGPVTLIPSVVSWAYLDRHRRERYLTLARAARRERAPLPDRGYRLVLGDGHDSAPAAQPPRRGVPARAPRARPTPRPAGPMLLSCPAPRERFDQPTA